jgi:hypothetical protein
MGLKGYRLWDMGQLDSTCRAPPRHAEAADVRKGVKRPRRHGALHARHVVESPHDVVLQVVYLKGKL